MQRGRSLFDHTKHTPEMKVQLADTFDKIVAAIEQDCPEMGDHHRHALGATVAEAIIALADAGQQDADRIYTYGLAQGSGFARSSGLFRDRR